MIKAGEPIKLLIVDSLTAHFRAEFSGRGQLADRQQKLNKYMHNLMKLADALNVSMDSLAGRKLKKKVNYYEPMPNM